MPELRPRGTVGGVRGPRVPTSPTNPSVHPPLPIPSCSLQDPRMAWRGRILKWDPKSLGLAPAMPVLPTRQEQAPPPPSLASVLHL